MASDTEGVDAVDVAETGEAGEAGEFSGSGLTAAMLDAYPEPGTVAEAKPEGATTVGETKETVVAAKEVVETNAEVTTVEEPWDTKRQASDQAAATLRKQNEELQTQLAAAKTASSTTTTGPEIDPDREMDEIATELSEMDKEIAKLDDLSDASEMQGLLTKQNALQVRHVNAQRAFAARVSAESQVRVETNNKAAYSQIINEICGEVGESHRNGILGDMSKLWADRGYGPGNFPNPDQVRDAAFSIGRRLAIDAGATAPAVTRSPKPSVTLDAGTGGDDATTSFSGCESMEEAVASMKAARRGT